MFNYIAHFPNQCFFLLVVSHSLYSHLSIYLGFLTSEMYCTLKRGTSIITLPVALVIPLHGYFMIICVFFFFFKICIVHTALPLLCLTATRKISFVLSFAVFFRRVFEVSNINKNHEVLRLNLSTFQPVSPKLNDK